MESKMKVCAKNVSDHVFLWILLNSKRFLKIILNWIIISNASSTHPLISEKKNVDASLTHQHFIDFHWMTHLRRIPGILKKTMHHRPIIINFHRHIAKHPWISEKKTLTYRPPFINSSLTYHQLITDLSLMYHRFSSRHRRRIPEFLKKHRNIADSSSTHHRPITKAPLIFTDASPKHLWISVKNVEVSPTIINSSLAYHQLITNLSLTHHRFS